MARYELNVRSSKYFNNEITVITGVPGSGKTELTLKTAINNAKLGKKVLFLSGQQTQLDLVTRLDTIDIICSVPYQNLRLKHDKCLERGLQLDRHYDLIVLDGYSINDFTTYYLFFDQWVNDFLDRSPSDLLVTFNVSRNSIKDQPSGAKIKDINQLLKDVGVKDIEKQKFDIHITNESCSIKTSNSVFITNTHILLDK